MQRQFIVGRSTVPFWNSLHSGAGVAQHGVTQQSRAVTTPGSLPTWSTRDGGSAMRPRLFLVTTSEIRSSPAGGRTRSLPPAAPLEERARAPGGLPTRD